MVCDTAGNQSCVLAVRESTAASLELDPRRAATEAEKPVGVLVSSRALTLLWLHFPTPRKRRFPRQDVRYHPTSLLQTGHRRAGAGTVGAAFSQGEGSH